MFWKRIFPPIVLLLAIWFSFDLICHLVVEISWFKEVGYLAEFVARLKTQAVLWAIAPISAGFLLFNLALAEHHLERGTQEGKELVLGLRWLLPVVLALSLVVGLIFIHYGIVAFRFWNPDLAVPSVLPPLPPAFEPKLIWQMWKSAPIWQVGILGGLAIAIIIQARFWLRAIAILISLSCGLVISTHWATFLQYFHATRFNITDPVYDRDISFYIFSLPVWELVQFWLVGVLFYALIAVTLIYLMSNNNLSNGKFYGFNWQQQRHLYLLGSAVMLCIAFSYWLRRYSLLYSTRGVIFGANYTDLTVKLPAYIGLAILASLVAILLLWHAIFSTSPNQVSGDVPRLLSLLPKWRIASPKQKQKNQYFFQEAKLIIIAFLFFLLVFSFLLPEIVQHFIVLPNELGRESHYIERSIKLTRQAFNLDQIEVKTFNPKGELSYADIEENNLTIRNIRIWDTRPLLQTNRQLQQIRTYYKFPSADIDRYMIKEQGKPEKRQVILAARELDYSAVPKEAQTWVNEHLVYTHGYGFTMSPVNTVGPGGLPDYFIKDIGSGSKANSNGVLWTANQDISDSIPIGNPRIYYGEITDTYVMTGTKIKELDYPSGNENTYNTYDGSGGISIGSWWQRLVFAEYLNDWQMLLTKDFTPQTKLLFRRNINSRIRAIAPFLRYDSQPYLVVADIGKENIENKSNPAIPNYLYWIIDAYTTSERYPYSDPGENKFNYIRNSVKVVIDAYNGKVDLYVADQTDPIIKTWNKVFPKMFKPLDIMPNNLRSHIRYPVDLFQIQSQQLLTYHMIDPQVFYNREDVWQVPNEIYGNQSQPVQPYYLIMKLPTEKEEEFILLAPFTPIERRNLIAWLAARSDGKEYGKLLLYLFPKQLLVYGQEQIEALINQDPVISQQISLWNREGAKATYGNLLIIPIEQSLLYVEPLYLEADQNSLPTLVRVIVSYQNRIVMAETLEEALRALFSNQKPTVPAIIRPV